MIATHASARPPEPPPDPEQIQTLDEVADYLRRLRTWADHVPYSELVRRINRRRDAHDPARKTTVYECFQYGRKRLDANLVLEISAALGLDDDRQSKLRRAIATAQGGASAVADVLASLPTPSAHFTGRADQLHMIVDRLPATTPPVALVTGPPGVGKTDLALAAADQLRRHLPDGYVQVYVDLHGFDSNRPPTPLPAVLAGVLRNLGASADLVHRCRTVTEQADLLRRIIAGRQVLMVLDNAIDQTQITHLLPGTPNCLVLITSRHRFDQTVPGLTVSLDAMTHDEALDLLRSFDPAGRVDAQPQAARRLADELCYRMPLDLVALGGRLADRAETSWTLADHVARLEWFPPDEVSRPALAASYDRLPAQAQRIFRLLTLHPGSDFTAYDAAALGDVGLAEAERLVGLLFDRHLLLQRQPQRFQLHDTVRAYADRLRHERDPDGAQHAARDRLLHHHRRTASLAVNHLHPLGISQPVQTAPPTPPITDLASATTWLDAERANLVTAAVHAADHDRIAHTVALATALVRYLDSGGHWQDAQLLHGRACRTDDPHQRAVALVNLGNTEWRLGAYRRADSRFQEALAVFRRAGDRTGQGRAQNGLGLVHYRLGSHDKARTYWQQALAAFQETQALRHEGAVLTNIGGLEMRLRRYDEALSHYRLVLEVAHTVDDAGDKATAFVNLGICQIWRERYDEALDGLARASRVAQSAGLRPAEARSIGMTGLVYQRQGRYDVAVRQLRDAIRLYRDLHDPNGEAEMRNHLAVALRLQGYPNHSMQEHQAALKLADDAGLQNEVARACEGMGRVLQSLGDESGATAYLNQALEIFRESGLPDADDVSGLLETVTH